MPKKHFFVFLLFLVLAFFFWSSYQASNWLQGFLGVSQDFINQNLFLSMIVFVALGALSAMFAFLSSAVLVPAVSFSWGPGLTFALLFGGWLLGGILTYFIGKYFGRPVVEKFFSPEKVSYYESKISPSLTFGLVFLFRLAMPAEIPGYLLGMLRYHFPKYFLATALAETPFALGAVYASESFLREEKILFIGLLLAGFLLISGAFYILRRRTNRIE